MTPKAVVLGGTGHIGAAIARRFHAAGFDVVATGHRPLGRPHLDGTGITVVSGDDGDQATLEHWLTGAAVVIDSATPYPLWIHDRGGRASPEAAVARVRRILEVVRRTEAHLTLVSSFTTLPRATGLLSMIGQGVLQGAHPYFDLKARVQNEMQAYIANGGQGVIIAPGTCFGPYDMKDRAQTFIPQLLAGKVPVLARHEMNVVDTRDVADVVLAASGTRIETPVSIFGHNINLRDLAQRVCALKGVKLPSVTVSTTAGATGMYWMETAYAFAGRRPPWPSLATLLLAASYPARPSDMQRRLHPGLRPLEQTLEDAIDWYDSIGYLSPDPSSR